MKSLLLAAFVLVATSAYADLRVGTYEGKDVNGQACELSVLGTHFEFNQPHPLNERVTLIYNNTQWEVSHPPEMDLSKRRVRFDHDHFRQILARADGAEAIWIDVATVDGKHVPAKATWLRDYYRESNKNQSLECNELVWKRDLKVNP